MPCFGADVVDAAIDFSLAEDGLDLVGEGMSWLMSVVSQTLLSTRSSRRSG